MKITTLAVPLVAAALAVPFSVVLASPASGAPCTDTGGACERDTPHPADANDKPVCQRSGGPTGDMTPCNSCMAALGNNPNLAQQVIFDCGGPGAVNPSAGQKPHCMVGEIHTGQPDCFGDLQADGSVTATN